MAKKPKEKKQQLALDMVICDPGPNKMFPDWMAKRVKFLIYSGPVACAECGKKKTRHWTMCCSFRVGGMATFVVSKGEKLHMPLTPVCVDHLLQPEIVEA